MDQLHSTYANNIEVYELNELSFKYTNQPFDELDDMTKATIKNLWLLKRKENKKECNL